MRTRDRHWLPWALLAGGFACGGALLSGGTGNDSWIGGAPVLVLGTLVTPMWGVAALLLVTCVLWLAGAAYAPRGIPWFVHGAIGAGCFALLGLTLAVTILQRYDVSSFELLDGASGDGCRVAVETRSMHRTGGQYEGRLHVIDGGGHTLRATATEWSQEASSINQAPGWTVRWEGMQGAVSTPEGVELKGSPVVSCR